jgi:death-on-curing family protein
MSRLEAAAARPRAEYGSQPAHPTLFQKTAALGHAIAQGHCFGNGNKRSAFFAINYVLAVNGWVLEMPDEIVAFMMLRVASNQNRMSVENMAYIIGAFAYVPGNRAELRSLRYLSSDALRKNAIVLVEPDQFPSPHPRRSRKEYLDKAQTVIDEQYEKMDPQERKMLGSTFRWPSQMIGLLIDWTKREEHTAHVVRLVRRRGKRVGKRRRPHQGGRNLPKWCGCVRKRHEREARLRTEAASKVRGKGT